MNRAQKTVMLIFLCAVAATLFLCIPKHGRFLTPGLEPRMSRGADGALLEFYEKSRSPEQIAWDRKYAWLKERLPKRAEYADVEARLGPRPVSSELRFVHRPDTREVLLRYALPLALMGLGLFVFFGNRKGTRAA